MSYDFCGWATKNNLKCADGRIICRDAFKVNNGEQVPLVWGHKREDPGVVLGHAILENREDGVYAYCSFNDTKNGKTAKEIVKHGDIKSMSIWANELEQVGPEVRHGVIREVSLVIGGANPGAKIESVLMHGLTIDEDDDECILYTGEPFYLAHAEKEGEEVEMEGNETGGGKTVEEVYKTLNADQKNLVAYLINEATSGGGEEGEEEEDVVTVKKEGGEGEMRHNIFDHETEKNETKYLSHEDVAKIFDDAKKIGSLREAIKQNVEGGVLCHSIDTTGMTVATGSQTYGFNDPSMLFPEFKSVTPTPEWISRDQGWVSKVMARVHRTPFARIKSVYADITEDEARAKGYIKGKQKKEEVFTTLKRTTAPQTIYKLQKMDRDDIVDITDFDVVAWIRAEMRLMLNEEIARAILIGDGRASDADDKIKEDCVRPIAKDVPLFNVTVVITVPTTATPAEIAKKTIDEIIRSRKKYKGSGNPDFWTTEDTVTEMLLLEDNNGRKIYKTESELATTLRAKEIIPVEPMEGMKIGTDEDLLLGVLVNLQDYNVGADKGGAINTFEDFDLNFNKHEYLIETRISGALIKPFSAITFVLRKTTTPKPSE